MDNTTSVMSSDPLGRSPLQVGFEVFFASLITVVAFLGNASLIYILHRDPRLKSTNNVFIESLGWTDLCMAVFKMPLWVMSIRHGSWAVSDVFCPWSAATMFTFGISSILNMGFVAINRYFKVVKPHVYLKIFKDRRRARIYAALVWAVSILLATPPLYGAGFMHYHRYFSLCTMSWEIKYISYVVVVVGGVVSGTTVVIFFCYYKIYKMVQSSSNNLQAHTAASEVQVTPTAPTVDIRVLMSAFTVVCFFLVTWVPVSFMVTYESAGGRLPRLVFAVGAYFMFVGSLGNPFIYGALNPKFRRAFACTFRCRGFDGSGNRVAESRDLQLSTAVSLGGRGNITNRIAPLTS